jgi:hypothetical protein
MQSLFRFLLYAYLFTMHYMGTMPGGVHDPWFVGLMYHGS